MSLSRVSINRSPPALRVLKQTSLTEEKVTKNGKTRSISVVVKNSPFQLSIGLDGALTNLNHLSFDMTLIYDRLGLEEKEVSYVTQKPIDYKTTLNDVGDQICFDVKIKVLSSHHEDNFFRLKVIVWDPSNDNFPLLDVVSQPIKVISKPMTQRQPKKRAAPVRRNKSESSSPELPTLPPAGSLTTVNNLELEASLNKLDSQQQHTIQLLNEILARNVEENPPKRFKPTPQLNPLQDFESAFSTMLRFYSSMSAEEKAERITKMVRSIPARDRDQLEELCDVLSHAGVKTVASQDAQGHAPPFIQDNFDCLAMSAWNWSNGDMS